MCVEAPDHLPLMLMLEVQFGDDYQARQMPAGTAVQFTLLAACE